MRIRQLAYFAISSPEITAYEVQRALGLPADRVIIAGSKSRDPLRPPAHSWQVVCDERGLTVDEQIAQLIARLEPARAAVRELVAKDGVCAVFQVVRYLNDDEGEEEDLTPLVAGMEKLPGQHQLLGWHLDAEQLEFIVDVRAALDVDEYG